MKLLKYFTSLLFCVICFTSCSHKMCCINYSATPKATIGPNSSDSGYGECDLHVLDEQTTLTENGNKLEFKTIVISNILGDDNAWNSQIVVGLPGESKIYSWSAEKHQQGVQTNLDCHQCGNNLICHDKDDLKRSAQQGFSNKSAHIIVRVSTSKPVYGSRSAFSVFAFPNAPSDRNPENNYHTIIRDF